MELPHTQTTAKPVTESETKSETGNKPETEPEDNYGADGAENERLLSGIPTYVLSALIGVAVLAVVGFIVGFVVIIVRRNNEKNENDVSQLKKEIIVV